MFQSKVFRKQFQSSLINMLKWFRSDGRNKKQKHGKDSKAILAFHRTFQFIDSFMQSANEKEQEGANGIIIENLPIQHVCIIYSLNYFDVLLVSFHLFGWPMLS